MMKVLWTMVLKMGFNQSPYWGYIMLYLVFGFWAGATLAIMGKTENMKNRYLLFIMLFYLRINDIYDIYNYFWPT